MQVLSVADVAVQVAQPSPQATGYPENKAYPAVAALQVVLSEQSEHPVIAHWTQIFVVVESKYHPDLQLFLFKWLNNILKNKKLI